MRAFVLYYLAILLCTIQLALSTQEVFKRDVNKQWEDLGWAWGKRSDPALVIPSRYLRSLHPVKKNPDWGDLGWSWGRRK